MSHITSDDYTPSLPFGLEEKLGQLSKAIERGDVEKVEIMNQEIIQRFGFRPLSVKKITRESLKATYPAKGEVLDTIKKRANHRFGVVEQAASDIKMEAARRGELVETRAAIDLARPASFEKLAGSKPLSEGYTPEYAPSLPSGLQEKLGQLAKAIERGQVSKVKKINTEIFERFDFHPLRGTITVQRLKAAYPTKGRALVAIQETAYERFGNTAQVASELRTRAAKMGVATTVRLKPEIELARPASFEKWAKSMDSGAFVKFLKAAYRVLGAIFEDLELLLSGESTPAALKRRFDNIHEKLEGLKGERAVVLRLYFRPDEKKSSPDVGTFYHEIEDFEKNMNSELKSVHWGKNPSDRKAALKILKTYEKRVMNTLKLIRDNVLEDYKVYVEPKLSGRYKGKPLTAEEAAFGAKMIKELEAL